MPLVCAISNEVPEHPCFSLVSNHLFERELIVKYIAENGTDPTNGQPLSEEQLIDIKVSHPIRPKAPSAKSPAMLESLQDECRAAMSHSSGLRQELNAVKERNTQLTKELSTAREALATVKAHLALAEAVAKAFATATALATPLTTALATIEPQAGLVAPQAVPAAQPAAVTIQDW